MYRGRWLVWFFVFGLTACGTTRYVYKQSSIVSNPYPAPSINPTDRKAYISAVNDMRRHGRTCGNLGYFPAAPALQWNNALYHAAYEHSADMSATDRFTHEGSATQSDWTMRVQHLGRASNFKDRIENNGYKQWRRLAQNIAAGMPSLAQTMEQWKTSAHHCENIMNPKFTSFGMAHVHQSGTRYNHYWTQNFAMHQ